jgi:CheY-like chemotaxis protein
MLNRLESFSADADKDRLFVIPENPRLDEIRILLIDDSEIVLESTSCLLEDIGAKVTSFNNGQEAVQYVKKSPNAFDIAIVDRILPGKYDGEYFAEEIAKINPDIILVQISGGEKTYSPIFSAEIVKPCVFPQIISKIPYLIAKKETPKKISNQ